MRDSADGAQQEQENKEESRFKRILGQIFGYVLSNWLIVGFGLGALLGYYFPHVAARGGIIRSEYSILYGGIALIFLINGMQLSPAKLKEHVTNWRLHIVVQGINLVLIPVIQLIIIRIVIVAGGVKSGTIVPSILVGMVVVSCTPTTIVSNVVMTRNAGGDEAAAIIEVVIGNVAGSILSPWLIYGLLPSEPEFNSLRPAEPSTLGPMYANVMQQLGLSVLLPLTLGQVLRWVLPDPVTWTLRTFRLAQLCSFLMILVAWSTFSGAFDTGALTELPTSSILFNVFLNVAEYILFTAVCYSIAYPPKVVVNLVNAYVVESRMATYLPSILRRAMTVKRMPRTLVVAVCFCGAAKTTSVGIPLAAAMWSQLDNFTIAAIQVPVLLYTVEQVFVAQFLTSFFKWWLRLPNKAGSDEETADDDQPEVTVGNGRNHDANKKVTSTNEQAEGQEPKQQEAGSLRTQSN